MNIPRLICATAIIGGVGLFATSANAATRLVDCDKGQSIQDALVKGRSHAEPLVINVTGTCEENVVIRRDDLTIDGNNNATVVGNIQNFGGRRIEIYNITITGPGLGLDNFGGDVDFRNVNVTGNQGVAGIASNQGGSVVIYDSNISNNAGLGVLALRGSTAEIHNTDILDNDSAGINVTTNSHADILDGCTISGNGTGVDVWLHSSALILDSEITSNDSVGILIHADSGVVTGANVNISSNVSSGVLCYDTESSFGGESVIIDAVDCTDFNQVAPAP